MRDINRIPKILKRLDELWESNPDLRLGQLILNVFHNKKHIMGKETNPIFENFYNIEDEEFIDSLEKFYNNLKRC